VSDVDAEIRIAQNKYHNAELEKLRSQLATSELARQVTAACHEQAEERLRECREQLAAAEETLAGYQEGMREEIKARVAQRQRADAAEAKVRELEKELTSTRQFWLPRFERMNQFMREEATGAIQERYFNIVANGTADTMESSAQTKVAALEAQLATVTAERDFLRESTDSMAKLVNEAEGRARELEGSQGDKCGA
jgi:chromosome segregation ATPase